MRDTLDRFYTKGTVAEKCITETLVLHGSYDVIVEPSAGSGAFSDKIDNCFAFDLEPSADHIVKQDWLTTTKILFPDYGSMLVIGNPPFGKRGALAKKFIEHAIKVLNAETIAFILPKTFNKRTNQKCFPNSWRLVKVVELSVEENTFILQGNKHIIIPCSFYIWTKIDSILPGKNLRQEIVPIPDEITFLPRGDTKSELVINGNNGKSRSPNLVTNPKAEHYIKISEGFDQKEVIDFLKTLKYDFHSSVNGGVAWINKEDISRTFEAKRSETGMVFARSKNLPSSLF